eukprot:Sspe_Gene.98667::Locus_72063_Transcript_1_1_Confidence_1.000_Length_678::g.98667::m.98667
MGALLSIGNHRSAAWHAAVPSYSSRYFSTNLGLVHLVALSLNSYNGVDYCTEKCIVEQKEWFRRDLSQVNRTETPWVVVMSHYPFYKSENGGLSKEPLAQQPWNVAEECEYQGHDESCRPEGWKARPLKYTQEDYVKDLEPIMYEYGVDLYWAGHMHYYQMFHGPIRNGTLVHTGYVNPRGVAHACSGNGGPGSAARCRSSVD